MKFKRKFALYSLKNQNLLSDQSHFEQEIRLLTFSIQAYDYSAADGNRRDVARFNYNNFAVFGIENYGFSSGHSTFNLTTNVRYQVELIYECGVDQSVSYKHMNKIHFSPLRPH